MKDWLYSKGAKYDKVKIVTQKTGYRGGIATKSIKVIDLWSVERRSHHIHTQVRTDHTIVGETKPYLQVSSTQKHRTLIAQTYNHLDLPSLIKSLGQLSIPTLSRHPASGPFLLPYQLQHLRINRIARLYFLVSNQGKSHGPQERLWRCLFRFPSFL